MHSKLEKAILEEEIYSISGGRYTKQIGPVRIYTGGQGEGMLLDNARDRPVSFKSMS
jgi:hypothetical protein